MSLLGDRGSMPGYDAVAITPDNDVDLASAIRGLYVGVSGNVKVTTSGGQTVTFVGLASGVVHPITAKRVFSTDTTATSIIGLY